MKISSAFETRLLQATNADAISDITVIQDLWGGLGKLYRVELICFGSQLPAQQAVVKHIELLPPESHPKGWNTRTSFLRKQHSYQVECHWYRHYAQLRTPACSMPAYFYSVLSEQEILLAISDLSSEGYTESYPEAFTEATSLQRYAVLRWLAHFHAKSLGVEPEGLWECGGYWHLDTRRDEWASMADGRLKTAAPLIDQRLRSCRYQSLVHGDAKMANFCFNSAGDNAAAVDFQYVGQGPGIKDVMLFISSAVPPAACTQQESELLAYYFTQLKQALALYKPDVDADALEAEWRQLYPWAWADFIRFAKGWSPQHWKINDYSLGLTEQVLSGL